MRHLSRSTTLAVALVLFAACGPPAYARSPGGGTPEAVSSDASGAAVDGAPATAPGTTAVSQGESTRSGATLPVGFSRIRATPTPSPGVDRFASPLWQESNDMQLALINCIGADRISRDPVYTFTLSAPVAKARIYMMGGDGVLFGPAGLGLCGNDWDYALPAGDYRLYARVSEVVTTAVSEIVIEDTAAEQATLAQVIAALPSIAIQPGVANPLFGEVSLGRLFDQREVGIPCMGDRSRRSLVGPMARVTLADDSAALSIGSSAWLALVSPTNTICLGRNAPAVPAGEHILYAALDTVALDAAAPPIALEIDVYDRALAYPQAGRSIELDEKGLAAAEIIRGTTAAAAPHQPSRLARASCAAAPAAPDLIVKLGPSARLRLLWSGAPLSLRVVGPLENKTAAYDPSFGSSGQIARCAPLVDELAPGSYAVWIGGAPASTDYQLCPAARRRGTRSWWPRSRRGLPGWSNELTEE